MYMLHPVSRDKSVGIGQGWWSFGGHKANVSIHFEEIISHAHENYERKNNFLESYIIIIIIIIIIKACYNKCMVQLLYL